jgi:hypothetical protein
MAIHGSLATSSSASRCGREIEARSVLDDRDRPGASRTVVEVTDRAIDLAAIEDRCQIRNCWLGGRAESQTAHSSSGPWVAPKER